jgi:Short C-terminal domain
MGGGSSLLGDLVAGGIGYLMGRQSAQQAPAPQYQPPQYQVPPPQYQPPQYQPPQTLQYQPPQAPPYQAPQYQAPAAGGSSEQLSQLKLLGHLRDSGLLTNDEFEAEKRKILQGY